MKIKGSLHLLMLVITGLMSCTDNEIYFDMHEQSIKTCNGNTIRNLTVDEIKGDYLYHFAKDRYKLGTNSFSLSRLDGNYTLEVMGQKLPLDKFKLKPNGEYKIRNSTYGDAASGEITVKTNDYGEIATADITSCR